MSIVGDTYNTGESMMYNNRLIAPRLYKKWIATDDCLVMDKNIKALDVHIERWRTASLSRKLFWIEKDMLKLYEEFRTELKLKFIKYDCVFNIEKKKLIESVDMLSDGFVETDKDVLEYSEKEQYILFSVGGIILLAGLFIITKK